MAFEIRLCLAHRGDILQLLLCDFVPRFRGQLRNCISFPEVGIIQVSLGPEFIEHCNPAESFCIFIAFKNVVSKALLLQMFNNVLKSEINFTETFPPGTFRIHWPAPRQIFNAQSILFDVESCSGEWNLDLCFDP